MRERKWVWDRRVGRWRLRGKFSRAPQKRWLRVDACGRFIDDAGKLVPTGALPGYVVPKCPKKRKLPFAPKSKPKVKSKGKKPPIKMLARGELITERQFVSSGRNTREPDNASEILSDMVESISSRTPFEPEDILSYQTGIKFVGGKDFTREVLSDLRDMTPIGGQLKVASTKLGTELYLELGSDELKTARDSADLITMHSNIIREYYDYLLDYWGDIDWYVYMDTDESLYE